METDERTLADIVEDAARYALCQPDWRDPLEANSMATHIRERFVELMELPNES